MKKFTALLLTFFSLTASGAVSEPDRALVERGRNLISNAGAENGVAGWVSSGGTFTATTTAADVGEGNAAFSWDSSAAAQTLSFTSAIPAGLFARNGVFSAIIKCAAPPCTHLMEVTDGTNTLVSQSITSQATYARTSVNFIFPSSGNVISRFSSVAANEPAIRIDGMVTGSADGINLSQVSQARWEGSVTFPATTNCAWSTTSNATFGSFPVDADCTLPAGSNIIGSGVDSPSTKIPAVKVKNVNTGRRYIFTARGSFFHNTVSQGCSYRFTNGVVSSAPHILVYSSSGNAYVGELSGELTFTSGGDHTVEIQGTGAFASTDCQVISSAATVESLEISVTSYPAASDQGFKPDQAPAFWSGYHDNTCSWSSSSTSYADPSDDASCVLSQQKNTNFGTVSSFGATGMGLTFTPNVAGTYLVIAGIGRSAQSTGAGCDYTLTDGSNNILGAELEMQNVDTIPLTLHAYLTASSVTSQTVKIRIKTTGGGTCTVGGTSNGQTLNWTVLQVSPALSAPILVGSVMSSSSGVEKTERVTITNNGSVCAVESQSGNWAGSFVRSGSTCAWTIAAGTFSGKPTCNCDVERNADSGICTNDSSGTLSATSWKIRTATHAGVDTDFTAHVKCQGPR